MPKQVYILIAVFCLGGLCFILSTKGNKKKVNNSFLSLIPIKYRQGINLYSNNQFSAEKAEVGRFFFTIGDFRLTKPVPVRAATILNSLFTDGYRQSIGALGDPVQRNSSPLINLVYYKYLTAADSSLHYPEQQIANPMFHTDPVELGWKGHEAEILKRLKQDGFYEEKMKSIWRKIDY